MLGVLMLQTRFPRPPGDVGHPASWRMPVRFATVPGASPQRVVRERDPRLLAPFIEIARALVEQGARALTTSCGFLYAWQAELQAALPVPMWTSSLLAVAQLPHVGVLTVDAEALRASEVLPASVPVEGLASGCHLQNVLLQDLPEMDSRQAEADAVAAALALMEKNPQLKHVVLECTNLPPYAAAMSRAMSGRLNGLLASSPCPTITHLMDWVHHHYEKLPS